MKKLFFVCVLMAALCACEAPGNETEKEVVNIETTGDTETSSTELTEAGSEDKDNNVATPTSAPAKKETDDTTQDEPGPTATPTPAASEGDKNVKNGGNTDNMITVQPFGGQEYAKGRELFCAAASEIEARDIAAVYGITFVDYAYGIATFTTTENPADVVNRGRTNGWVTLDINYVSTIQ